MIDPASKKRGALWGRSEERLRTPGELPALGEPVDTRTYPQPSIISSVLLSVGLREDDVSC